VSLKATQAGALLFQNSLPLTNDTEKRYCISTESVAETGIGGFYKKNLAKISLLLKRTNIGFIAIHSDFSSRR